MNLKNYQEKADYILKKEEEMSFKEFAEGLLNYSFQKGLEKELNKLARWEVDNKELDDYLIKRNIQKEFDLGYRSYIGDFFLSDRVNFLEKRAEEFGLELDEEYEIKNFKTEELEKEFAELKNMMMMTTMENFLMLTNLIAVLLFLILSKNIMIK